MIKIIQRIFFVLVVCVMGAVTSIGQQSPGTGIGTTQPDKSAVLELKSTTQGILLPRLTTVQRDAIPAPALGLTIYNSDNNCIESWTGVEWVGNCGTSPAQISTVDCNTVRITGTYKQGSALNALDSLIMTLNVIKSGTYSISATPNPANGYYFNTSGTFSAKGTVNIGVVGQGTPQNPSTTTVWDTVSVSFNNSPIGCKVPVNVATSALPANYTINCAATVAAGVGQKGKPLTSANYITVVLQGGTLGSTYNITTNTVDGISFSASGIQSSSPQTVTLTPVSGSTPGSYGTKAMTVTFNNTAGTTCNVNYIVAAPQLTIAQFALNDNRTFAAQLYGGSQGDGYKLMMSANNFGTTGTVKSLGFAPRYYEYSDLTPVINSSTPPDIVIIGYQYYITTTQATALTNYMSKGGIVFLACEYTSGTLNLFNALGYTGVSRVDPGGSYNGDCVKLNGSGVTSTDPILNGSFGNLGASNFWGSDAGAVNDALNITSIPANERIVYSMGTNGSPFFRLTKYPLIYAGEGGFLGSNSSCPTCSDARPLAIDGNSKPVTKNNYYNGANYTGVVSNSIIFANFLEWAINQAVTNGINKSKF